jgi:hypothetical protein
VVATPATFGAFPNAILVGNFGDGTINAFDTKGKFLGQLTDSSNKVLVNPGLWEIVFGGGGASGDPGTLYLTAGGGNQPNFPAGGSTTSVFASLVPAATVGAPNFSLSLSAQSATIAPGSSANLTINTSAVGGFNGQVSLSCSPAAGLTCAFNPSMISPGAGGSSMLTVSAASTPPVNGYSLSGVATLLPGLGLFGTLLTTRKRKPGTRKSIMSMSILGLVLFVSFLALGCGGSNSKQTPPGSQVTLMVTGTSGSLSHSAPVAITVR